MTSGVVDFVTFVQLPFVAVVTLCSAAISCAVRNQVWCKRRPVEVALKVAGPPVLVVGAWAALAVGVPLHTDPLGVALVACLLLRIIMFTNKVHSMQSGGTDLFRAACSVVLVVCWVWMAGLWAVLAAYREYVPTLFLPAAQSTAVCDYIQPLWLRWSDCVGLCAYCLCLAAHSCVWWAASGL